jgi:CheY-like chemotaxis protein
LDWLTVNPASLILLDMTLPGMSGGEVVEHLRNTPSTKQVPVVVITGMDITGASIRELRGRVAEILQKGAVTPPSLVEQVKTALRRMREIDD